MLEQKILSILERELIVACGCTDPLGIAFTAATAAAYLGEPAKRLRVLISGNVMKNAMSVIIPGTNCAGVALAASLGALIADNGKKLELLTSLTAGQIEQARQFAQGGTVSVELTGSPKMLYIEVNAFSEHHFSRAVVEDDYTNITRIESNGKVVQSCASATVRGINEDALSIEAIWDFINTVPLDKLSLIRKAISLNCEISREGMKNSYGLMVGKTMAQQIGLGLLEDTVENQAVAITAAGADARMAGCQMSVMSNSGSGNQGITATMPVVSLWEKLQLPEEKLLRAVALSHLIAIYIKERFGRLSALCGVTVAATGASCGIVYLYGYGLGIMKAAIQNMFGNLTGMLCDGAKAGCSLKVSSGTSAAFKSALLATQGITIRSTDGIIEDDVEKTIDNVCELAVGGTREADRIILDIMLHKVNRQAL